METIVIGKNYAEIEKYNTQKEIERLLSTGVKQVTLENMQNMLSEIGLTLDLNTNGYLYLYYNTSNENKYYQATTSPLDNKKISVYNINSEFYNKHLKDYKGLNTKTEYAQRLYELRMYYFCTIKKRNIEYILSF